MAPAPDKARIERVAEAYFATRFPDINPSSLGTEVFQDMMDDARRVSAEFVAMLNAATAAPLVVPNPPMAAKVTPPAFVPTTPMIPSAPRITPPSSTVSPAASSSSSFSTVSGSSTGTPSKPSNS